MSWREVQSFKYPGMWRRMETRRDRPVREEKPVHSKQVQVVLAIIAAVFAIATPALYAAGTQFDALYLSGLGVPADLFPRSTQYYVTYGVLSFATSVTYLMPSLWDAFRATYPFVVLGIVMILLWRYADDERNPPPPIPAKWRPHFQVRKFFGAAGVAFIEYPLHFYLAVLTALFIGLGSVVVPFQAGIEFGRRFAQDTIKKRKDYCKSLTEAPSPSCVELLRNGQLIARGSVVAASERFIAIYAGGTTTIIENKDLILRAMVAIPGG